MEQTLTSIIDQYPWLPFAIFAPLVLIALLRASDKGSWREMARYYKTDKRVNIFGKDHHFPQQRNIRFGMMSYKGAYAIPLDEGLYICFPMFAFMCPRLLVPWNRIKIVKTIKIPFTKLESYDCTVQCSGKAIETHLSQPIINFAREKGHFQA